MASVSAASAVSSGRFSFTITDYVNYRARGLVIGSGIMESPSRSAAPPASWGRVVAVPATRRLARELKVDIRLVPPTGPAGPHASELIAEGTLALEMGATLEDLMVTIHPHPTLSEAIMEASEVAAGSAVHVHATKR